MAQKTTRKKPTRKRRSFFEPESKVLAKWLADQNDLGVSLQLIIVDAIRNYGEGDVIQAFLTARERVPGEPQVTSSLPVPTAVLQPSAPDKAARKTSSMKDKVAGETSITPDAPEDELSAEVTVQPEAPKPEPAKAKAAPAKQAPAPEPADDSDPLAIMFGDIGSSLNQN